MDYYNVKPKVFAGYYNKKVERFKKEIIHLKHIMNTTDEDLSRSFSFNLAVLCLDAEVVKWYVDNYDVGGVLDSYDDRRTRYYKSLKAFCENNFHK